MLQNDILDKLVYSNPKSVSPAYRNDFRNDQHTVVC
jgi:hypothetical protein